MIQKIAEGRSDLDLRLEVIFTKVVMGCRIKKAAKAIKMMKNDATLHVLPAANPMSKGDKRNIQEPWSVGKATCRRKYFLIKREA